MKKTTQRASFAFIILAMCLCIVLPFNSNYSTVSAANTEGYIATVSLKNVNTYEKIKQDKKLRYGHGTQTGINSYKDLDLSELKNLEINIELKDSFSETAEFSTLSKQREKISEEKYQDFLILAREKTSKFYQQKAEEFFNENNLKAEYFETSGYDGFLQLKVDELNKQQICEAVEIIEESNLVQTISFEKHEIEESGWFGSWTGETLKTINGIATHNSSNKGKGAVIGVCEADNGIPDKNKIANQYKNLSLTTHSSGEITQHATIVTDIIAAIAPQATIYAAPTSQESWLIQQGCTVINCSWKYVIDISEQGKYCSSERRYDKIAFENFITYVFGAGNDGKGIACPSAAANVVTVGATDNNGKTKASYSNYSMTYSFGKPNIAANGAPHTPLYSSPFHTDLGTSYAAPMVTGAIGVIIGIRPLTAMYPERIQALLAASANSNVTSGGSVVTANMNDYFGAGMLDVDKLVASVWNNSDFSVDSSGSSKYVKSYLIYLTKGQTLKAAMFWFGQVPPIGATRPLFTDYDLHLDFNNARVASSVSSVNNTEMFTYIAPTSGYYTISAYQWGARVNANQTDCGSIAWSIK